MRRFFPFLLILTGLFPVGCSSAEITQTVTNLETAASSAALQPISTDPASATVTGIVPATLLPNRSTTSATSLAATRADALKDPTPSPTSTLASAATALNQEPPISVGMGGFAFQPVQGYQVEVNVSQATVSDPGGDILLSMLGASPAQIQPVEDLLADFLENMTPDSEGFSASEAYIFTIADRQGLAADVRGTLCGKPFTGRVVVILPSSTNAFYLMGIGLEAAGIDHWVSQGEALFKAISASISFFEPTDSTCPVADDPSYGYSPENPIQVGGDGLQGADRESTYLTNLRGPNFEPVSYERFGPVSHGDLNLDRIQVTYPGQPATAFLYLDRDNYTTLLKAPVGFKCPEAFNFPPP